MSHSPLPGQVTRPAFEWRPDSCHVSYGSKYPKLLQEHIQRLGRHRVLAIISGSLVKNNPEELDRLESALQETLVLKKIGMKSHTDWQEVLDVAMTAYVELALHFSFFSKRRMADGRVRAQTDSWH